MSTAGVHDLELAGEAVVLDARRALVWPARKTVILADPHIGKGDTFRRAGIPVPARAAAADFDRLSGLLSEYDAQRLVVLGDFLHARPDSADDCIERLHDWRQRFASLEVLIVRGNHDAHAGPPPSALGLFSVDEPFIDGPFVCRHFPVETDLHPASGYVLAGHLHPGITVALGSGGARRVPCFHRSNHQMILPAFGGFTGTGRIRATPNDEVFAVGRGRVIALPRPTMV